jgi:hypothetical protein
MWMIWVQGVAAIYLVGGSILLEANSNLQSKIFFKVVPMFLGQLLAFGIAARLLNWPV